MTQLRQYEDEFAAREIAVAIVTFDAEFMARAYVDQTNLQWPLLIDADHATYEAYGMKRASWWTIYRPSSLWNYVKLIFRGRTVHKPGSDYRQLGGDVLIDPAGMVRLHYLSESPHDRPTPEEILAQVAAGNEQ